MNEINLSKCTKRIDSIIEYSGYTAEQVFAILGEPDRITDWYLLAKQVHKDPESDNFKVEFTFFGVVDETILHWDPPYRYVYSAAGADFPIQDYIAEIRIDSHGEDSGVLTWTIYFDDIEGEEFQRVLPIMITSINEASMHQLAKLIGGHTVKVTNYG
jgi:hypothetical protein